MLKRLLLLVLSVALILSFSACGKSKDKDGETDKKPNSSVGTSGDATQDFDDEWDEDQLTDEEREDLEDLWGELTDNVKPEISGGSSSVGSSSEATSSEDEGFKGTGTIGKVPGAIF